MYKVVIKKTAGMVTTETTLETEDVMLVARVMGVDGVVSVDSDVPNRNIDPAWQILEQIAKKQSNEKPVEVLDKETSDWIEEFSKNFKENEPHPFAFPNFAEWNNKGTGWNNNIPLTVTC